MTRICLASPRALCRAYSRRARKVGQDRLAPTGDLTFREQRSCWYFFFFQAEDGIRDYKVTGVQTCALPISLRQRRHRLHRPVTVFGVLAGEDEIRHRERGRAILGLQEQPGQSGGPLPALEIGRASCRERV